MRLKNVPGSREVIGESRFVIHEPELQKGKWKEVFGNENPSHIEIGMGKIYYGNGRTASGSKFYRN